ncbi:MAG TPA: SDR family oxidoreductase [Tepidiformaceae bacterium]|jgi:NAD(P)-dependent dehydrogenase (short-subunit alcohol dehydrogenase family)|nr:SDR family oxidoreductase [Tepidiformaceae bacterium]
MAISFEGQVALVTGAGAGLGRAYALDLARRGAKVVVNDLGGDPHGQGADAAPARKVCDEIKAAGGEATPNFDSVSSYDGGFNMVKTAIDTYGRLDVVICNAGILRDIAFHNMSEADWDAVFAVHIKGSFTVLRAAWPVFRQQSYGRVVLTTSSSGIYGQFGQANYGSAKTAMLGLMNVLKQEGAKYNVNVNTVAPVAGTRLTQTVMPQEMVDKLKPELVSPAVVYMASKECDDSGLIIEAGAGNFNRATIVKGPGVQPGMDDLKDAEWIQSNWDKITSLEGAEPMWRTGQTLKAYLAEKKARG